MCTRRLPVEDTDQIVLATVDDINDGSVFMTRLHAPPHIKNLTVEMAKDKFEKLAIAVGNVMNPGHDLVRRPPHFHSLNCSDSAAHYSLQNSDGFCHEYFRKLSLMPRDFPENTTRNP